MTNMNFCIQDQFTKGCVFNQPCCPRLVCQHTKLLSWRCVSENKEILGTNISPSKYLANTTLVFISYLLMFFVLFIYFLKTKFPRKNT